MSTFFYGDPHGDFGNLNRAAGGGEIGSGDTVVLMGDYNPVEPLRTAIAPVIETGADARWILGNHDVDDHHAFDFVATDWPDADLHGRVHVDADGRAIAGLGGVFKGRIWRPTQEQPDAAPSFPTRASYLQTLKHCERWRGGLPLRQRDTIWHEDVEALGLRRCDVLVTHEAPSTHPYGSPAIDALAKRMGCSLIVHGHHHRAYSGVTADGIEVRGLAIAELWRMP